MRASTSAYNAAYRAEHRDDLRVKNLKHRATAKARQRERQREDQAYLSQLKSERGCVVCRERDAIVLCFHHRDPKTKKYNVGAMAASGITLPRILTEVAKCDVMCFNCHARVTWGAEKDGKLFR